MKWYKNKRVIEAAVYGSWSYAQILRKLGLRDNGSSFYTLKKALKKFSIVFKPNYNYPRDTLKIPLEKILVKNSTYGDSNKLKWRLIKEKIFEHKCYKCERKKWNGEDIPIQLDHKNGDRTNNTIENLIILCPNCHAQTPTFCRGGKRKYSTSMKMKEKKVQKKFRKQYLKNKEYEVSLLLKKKRQKEIKNRINDLKVINVRKFGWVQKLSEKWGVSHPQIRRFLKRHNPEIYIDAFERKPGKRW